MSVAKIHIMRFCYFPCKRMEIFRFMH
jgi:hypothetical protein